jgi:hypothetical protein
MFFIGAPIGSRAAVAECRIGGSVPDLAFGLVVAVGTQPRRSQRLAASGTTIVVRTAAMDLDNPGGRIAIPLALEGQEFTYELATGWAAMQTGRNAVRTRIGQPFEIVRPGRSAALEVVADDVARAAIRVFEGREAGSPVRQLRGLGELLRKLQPVGDRQAVRQVLRLAVGAVEVEIDRIAPAEHHAGVEPIRIPLPTGEVDESLAGPVRGQERDVAQGAVADAGHEIRVAIAWWLGSGACSIPPSRFAAHRTRSRR